MKHYAKLAALAAAIAAIAMPARADGTSAPVASPASAEPTEGRYTVRSDQPAQTILGLGYEIQSDSIGSGNSGLPDAVVAVPHDLVPSERERFYKDMLHGFRYCRLAMGLYLRGTDADGKHVIERYPGQMADLLEMQKKSGIEGFDTEYWSPPPYWKSSHAFNGLDGHLKSFDPAFLSDFGDACVQDVKYLQDHGLKVVQWGLQNEPGVWHVAYSCCGYHAKDYALTFAAVAPKIKAAYPNVLVHATSWHGAHDEFGKALLADPEAVKSIDAWSWHSISVSSDVQIDFRNGYLESTGGKPVFNNEFEYFHPLNDGSFNNTAQSIMNWFVFENAPTWYWLHALKPTYNDEASSYGLGFWRPADDNDMTKNASIDKGHWDYNPRNFNAIAGFLKYMPWDSRRLTVDETAVLKSERILAYRTPKNKLCVVLSNRLATPFTFHVVTDAKHGLTGHRYTQTERDTDAGKAKGATVDIAVPARSVEFWVED